MNYQAEQRASESDRLLFSNEPCKPLLRRKGEPPFNDSWEAEAYALGNLLVKLNHVTPKEWMDLMAESIQEAQSFGDPDTGETYYQHWCRSLEKFCFETGLSHPSDHREILDLWKRAISNTPHGVPLSIENAFLSSKDHDGVHQHHGHGYASQSATPDCAPHVHSHERPPVPPATYYEPIAKQILKSPSI
jgi:nitrile hydratase accessory protein